MRESAFQAACDPIAFSAESIYQHLLCARSWWETEMRWNLVLCPGRARNLLEVPLSPQHWLRPWDGVSGPELSEHLSSRGPRGSEEGASAHGCSWMVSSLLSFSLSAVLLLNLLPSSTFETRICQPSPKTHQEASTGISDHKHHFRFSESILPSLYSARVLHKWRTEIMYRESLYSISCI